jgi:hypothetical protein
LQGDELNRSKTSDLIEGYELNVGTFQCVEASKGRNNEAACEDEKKIMAWSELLGVF